MAAEDEVVVTTRQMTGSAPEKRTFHRPSCPSLKTRNLGLYVPEVMLSRRSAVEAHYRPCQRCKP